MPLADGVGEEGGWLGLGVVRDDLDEDGLGDGEGVTGFKGGLGDGEEVIGLGDGFVVSDDDVEGLEISGSDKVGVVICLY